MRIITTAILGVTAIILAAVTHFVDRKIETAEDNADLARVAIRFEPEQVDRIVIEQGTKKVVIEARNRFWYFSEPEEDRVDPAAVSAVLDVLNHLSILDTIEKGEGEEMSPQSLGLKGDDAIKVTVSGPSEKGSKDRFKEGVIVGVSAPREETVYARRVGEDDSILVVDGNPRPWISEPLQTLRDRRILGAPVEAIVQMVIGQSTGQIALQRRITPPAQDWAIVKPIQVWADKEKLDQMLATLASFEIQEVASTDGGAIEIPNPIPENAAVFQFQVYGIEQPLTLYLKEVDPGDGVAPPQLEAVVSGRPGVYRFYSPFLSQLPGKANELRDRTLARIPIQFLDSVVIESLIDPPVVLMSEPTQEGRRWQVSLNNELVTADTRAVADLVSGVNETPILDFVSDSGDNLAEYGLNPPARSVTFRMKYPGQPDAQGNPGQVQQQDRVLNLGWREGEEQRLFANFAGDPYIYELDPSFVGLIPTHPIKWRSLEVLKFNPMHLISITRETDDGEKLKLEYNYKLDEWEAERNGIPITESIDEASVRRLRDRLGGLTASGWALSLPQAYEALQEPAAVFTIVTDEFDPAIGDRKRKTTRVRFAKAIEEVYFGQIEGSPDVFTMDYSDFRNLKRPVTTRRAN